MKDKNHSNSKKAFFSTSFHPSVFLTNLVIAAFAVETEQYMINNKPSNGYLTKFISTNNIRPSKYDSKDDSKSYISASQC